MAVQQLRIKIRRDESANWERVNPILYLAEQGYETDTRKMKIGDGVRRYLDLPYFGETLETIDGFLITSKLNLEVKTKFLIRDLSIFDGREMETQEHLNAFLVEQLNKNAQKIQVNEEKIDSITTSVSGLEVILQQLDDRVEIIEDSGLTGDYVALSGDTMTGTLRIKEEDGFAYNISERTQIDGPVGLVTITKDDEVKFESYYSKQDNVYIINLEDPAIPNPSNAITISGDTVTIGRNLNVTGQIFASGVDILDVLQKEVEIQLNRIGITGKYDKVGGPIHGPVIVFPGGTESRGAMFLVNSGGVFTFFEPTDDQHVVNKGWVDKNKMPYDITRLRRLNTVQSFLG